MEMNNVRWRRSGRRWQLQLFQNGEVASELTLLRTTRRFGKSILTAGGLAGVRTQEKWRGRGFARELIEVAHSEMLRRKYGMSLLYGIPDMYEKFGYATVESVPQLQIDVAEIVRCGFDRRGVRRARNADAPSLARFYNKANAGRSGTAHRSADDFARVRDHIHVMTNERGSVSGYSVHEDKVDQDEDRFHVWELEATDVRGYVTLLGKLAHRAVRLGGRSLNIWTIENHPIREIARRFRSNYISYHNRDAGGMARIIDVQALARQILPELSRRWQAHQIDEPGLSIVTESGRIDLRSAGSGLKLADHAARCRVSIGQQSLMQIIMGYRHPNHALQDASTQASSRGASVVTALFENNHPCGSWYEDQF